MSFVSSTYRFSTGLAEIGVHTDSQLYPKPVVYRRRTLLELGTYHRTVIIWVKDVESVLRMFAETAMFCHQKIDVGVYDPSDRFEKEDYNFTCFTSYSVSYSLWKMMI